MNNLLETIGEFVKNYLLKYFDPNTANILFIAFIVVSFLGFITISVIILTWAERRVLGFFQDRLGPNRVGPQGIFQGIADALKLLSKELIFPSQADKLLFLLSPLLIFVPSLMLFASIPFSQNAVALDLNVGILYILAVSMSAGFGVLLAGWSSNNKFSLLGAVRTVAKDVAYEIPIVVSILTIVLLSSSMNLNQIILAQKSYWFILVQPVAFFIFILCSAAELNRNPFDLVEAESEIIGGYHTEYGGIMFAFFYLSEYTNLFFYSILGSILFLGGWSGPFLPPFAWLLLKSLLLIFVFIWLRATLPRFRIDQLLKLNWNFLVPLALINLVITSLIVVL